MYKGYGATTKKKKRKIGWHIVLFGINRNCFLFATQKKKKKKEGLSRILKDERSTPWGVGGGEPEGGKITLTAFFPFSLFPLVGAGASGSSLGSWGGGYDTNSFYLIPSLSFCRYFSCFIFSPFDILSSDC